jgi:hypothetical protein
MLQFLKNQLIFKPNNFDPKKTEERAYAHDHEARRGDQNEQSHQVQPLTSLQDNKNQGRTDQQNAVA